MDELTAKGFPVSIKVIKDKQLRDGGFGGIWGVGKAAEQPPALAILTYTPAKSERTVCWVGKGIVYDSGGLSIKTPTANMCGMKVYPFSLLYRLIWAVVLLCLARSRPTSTRQKINLQTLPYTHSSVLQKTQLVRQGIYSPTHTYQLP